MTDESIQLIVSKLELLASKLGVTIEQIWPWIIRQQYVEAIYFSIFALISTILSCILITFTIKHWNPKEGYAIYPKDHEPFWVFGCVAFAAFALIFIVMSSVEIADIFNPQYASLKDLMNLIQSPSL